MAAGKPVVATNVGGAHEAIRDGENRVLFSGYATTHYKLFIFILAVFDCIRLPV